MNILEELRKIDPNAPYFSEISSERDLPAPFGTNAGFINSNRLPILITHLKIKEKNESFYQCLRCREIFSSWKGASSHACFFQRIDVDDKTLYMEFIEWICITNTSASAISHPLFNTILTQLKVPFSFERHSVAKAIHELAENIQNHMLLSLNGKYVSILIDGAKKYWKSFEGALLFVDNQIRFFSLINLKDATALSLSKIISHIALEIQTFGGKVVSCCTDNASNNIKALNVSWPSSAQNTSHVAFIRIPCFAHTGELAIHDLFGPKKKYHFIVSNINIIIEEAKKLDIHVSNITERWSSLCSTLKIIIKYYAILRHNNDKLSDAFQNIEHFIYLSNLYHIIEIAYEMICAVEKDSAHLSDGFLAVFSTCQRLSREKHQISIDLAKSIIHRFMTTETLYLPLFAYLLTPHGIYDYFNSSTQFQTQLHTTALQGAYAYLKDLSLATNANIQEIHDGFFEFIQNSAISKPDELIWDHNSSLNVNHPLFSEIARMVSSMPCSEAAVERLFSRSQHVFVTTRAAVSDQTLNARLAIKMNYILQQSQSKQGQTFPDMIQNYSDIFEQSVKYMPNALETN